jgi:hypothetical protein
VAPKEDPEERAYPRAKLSPKDTSESPTRKPTRQRLASLVPGVARRAVAVEKRPVEETVRHPMRAGALKPEDVSGLFERVPPQAAAALLKDLAAEADQALTRRLSR